MTGASGALAAYWRFFDGFNSRDAATFTDSLNFPHVRLSPWGEPRVLAHRSEHERGVDFARLRESGWVRSVGAEPEVIHQGRDCVHVAGGWTRYDADDEPILSNYVTYVITCVDGHWGMQSRFGVDPGRAALDPTGGEAAREVASRWLDALAAGDYTQAGSLLHLPQIVISPGSIEVLDEVDAGGSRAIGQSTSLRIVHAGPKAVTLAADGQGEHGQRCGSVLFVAERDGRWGIVARSTCMG